MATLPESNGHSRATLASVTEDLDALAATAPTTSGLATHLRVRGEELWVRDRSR
jgi:hypothetical protein